MADPAAPPFSSGSLPVSPRRTPVVRGPVLAVVLLALLGLVYWAVAVQHPAGPRSARSFDPDRLAALETSMWRAYYQKDNLRLATLLLQSLREQFHYPWGRAASAALHLARAASSFGTAHDHYERSLPDLERAYRISREWTGATYDPAQVAAAELAWWVARREPGQNSPDNVGRLIGVLYGRFYEIDPAQVTRAGILRARAAALRDQGGEHADWTMVAQLLRASYRSLHEVVNQPR